MTTVQNAIWGMDATDSTSIRSPSTYKRTYRIKVAENIAKLYLHRAYRYYSSSTQYAAHYHEYVQSYALRHTKKISQTSYRKVMRTCMRMSARRQHARQHVKRHVTYMPLPMSVTYWHAKRHASDNSSPATTDTSAVPTTHGKQGSITFSHQARRLLE